MNRFLTRLAKTEVTVVDTIKRGSNLSQHHLTTPSRFLRHCLRLHGIHTRQSPHPGLVQFNNAGRLVASSSHGLKFLAESKKPLAHVGDEKIGHTLSYVVHAIIRSRITTVVAGLSVRFGSVAASRQFISRTAGCGQKQPLDGGEITGQQKAKVHKRHENESDMSLATLT